MSTPGIYGAHETRFYYVEEVTYGVCPETPAMQGILATESVEPAINPSNIKVRGIGSVDLAAIKRGLLLPGVKVAYALPSEAPINFLQHAEVEPDDSLSLEVVYYKGIFGSETDIISLLYEGCKFQSLTVGCSIEDVIKASAELIGRELTTGTVKKGLTYGDHSGAVPWYESYVKKGVTGLERVTDWKWTIVNNLKAIPVIKTSSESHMLKYLPHRHRNLTGEITFEFESKEEFDDVIGDTEFTLEFGLGGSPVNKAVFSNCKWDNVVTPTRIEDLVALKAPFVAKTVTIS